MLLTFNTWLRKCTFIRWAMGYTKVRRKAARTLTSKRLLNEACGWERIISSMPPKCYMDYGGGRRSSGDVGLP
jgi:hypothetical protein